MFSYSEFKNIINLVKVYLPIVDFSDVINYNPKIFCVVRHDIEFSIDRALQMARIEAEELGITSTYTVQLNAFNYRNGKIYHNHLYCFCCCYNYFFNLLF